MSLLFPLSLVAVGLIILVLGADWLVRGSVSIATRFGISPLAIGLTLVAIGTSAPELAVNVYAALVGSPDIAIGNVLGSNIANILLILGISAIIVPLSIQTSAARWGLPLALFASVLVIVLGNDAAMGISASNALSRIDGGILIVCFVLYLWYVKSISHEPDTNQSEPLPVTNSSLAAVALSVAGLIALAFGGRLLVDGAVSIARGLGLTESLIALTIVAVGTSLPELATSVVAAVRRQNDIAVGNIVGSNIINVFWVLGLTAIVLPLPVPPTFMVDALLVLGATLALVVAVFVGRKGYLERWQGFVFLALYIAFILYLVSAS